MKNSQIEKIKSVFNKWAISGKADQIESGHTYAVNQMFKLIQNKNVFKFLDIGCGNGWTVRKASALNTCKLAYGIDISNEMIKLAEERKLTPKEKYVCVDICDWQSDEKFDLIFSMETFYYIEDLNKAFKNVHKRLEKNGTFMMGIDFYHENEASSDWSSLVGVNMRRASKEQWREMFEKAGFKNINIVQIKETRSAEEWKRNIGTLFITASN